VSGAAKAALVGAVVAAVLVIGGIVAVTTGTVELPLGNRQPEKILVVAVAEDQDGAESAALAYVADAETGQVTLLDTLEEATVAGTSARSAAQALPFGGGKAVAEALSSQTGGTTLEWIVVPADTWTELVDDAGGITVDVPQAVSAYTRGGGLSLLEPGRQKLSGSQALALATAARFAGTAAQQSDVLRQLTAAFSAVAGARGETLRDLVTASKAESSLRAEQVPDLSSVQ